MQPTFSIAIRPPVSLERMHGGQPVLKPVVAHPWESTVVLNPAAVLVESPRLTRVLGACGIPTMASIRLEEAGAACVMLYRAQGARDPISGVAPSSVGLAVLTPDLHVVHRLPRPVLGPSAPHANLGVEDPRCTLVDDTYYLYYTGYAQDATGERGVRICLATSSNLVDWLDAGPVAGDINAWDNKNAALLPVQVDDRWMLLHRPMAGPNPMAIHWAESDSPAGPWTSRGVLMSSHRFAEFSRSWIGAGGPPIWLGEARFLMIYHMGHFTPEGTREYDLAAALLDFAAPNPVRARIEPILRPAALLEQKGDDELGVDNVLFTCANYLLGSDLIVPYAGADSRIFGARVSVADLVNALEKQAA